MIRLQMVQHDVFDRTVIGDRFDTPEKFFRILLLDGVDDREAFANKERFPDAEET